MVCFINVSCYLLCFGVLSIVYVLPNYGYYPKSELKSSSKNLIFPKNYAIFISFYCFTRILSLIYFSRGENLKSIFNQPGIYNKFTSFLTLILGSTLETL
jgi:hypothetical protein